MQQYTENFLWANYKGGLSSKRFSCWLKPPITGWKQVLMYRTRAIIGRSRFEAALVYKPRILSLKNEEFPFLVHKLSAI